jgi:hypothetical protein
MQPVPQRNCPVVLSGTPGRRRVAVVAVIAVAVVVVAVGLAALFGGGGKPGNSSAVSVAAGGVTAVDLSGVPGQLTIVGTSGGRVALTGSLHWAGRAAPVTRTYRADGVLHLSYRCGSPCTEDYRLAVPGRTAVAIRQPSGHVVISGLSGPLRITARSVNVSATGLRSPALTASITSGHLTASFAVPPRRLSLALTSAQATVRLPTSVRYLVSSQVTSGYVKVGVPEARGAARTVTARVDSGELNLLPT